MGLSEDIFVAQPVLDEYKCPICNDVLLAPVMITECEHIFCTQCLDTWKFTSNSCPLDRKNIGSLKSPPRVFMSIMNKLELHCGFTFLGCTAIVQLGQRGSHEEGCEYNMKRTSCRLTMTELAKENSDLRKQLAIKDKEILALKLSMLHNGAQDGQAEIRQDNALLDVPSWSWDTPTPDLIVSKFNPNALDVGRICFWKYTAKNSNQISLSVGDVVDVVRSDCRCEGGMLNVKHGDEIGWVPCKHLIRTSHNPQEYWKSAICKRSYTAQKEPEISIRVGDEFRYHESVKPCVEDGWFRGFTETQFGILPSTSFE